MGMIFVLKSLASLSGFGILSWKRPNWKTFLFKTWSFWGGVCVCIHIYLCGVSVWFGGIYMHIYTSGGCRSRASLWTEAMQDFRACEEGAGAACNCLQPLRLRSAASSLQPFILLKGGWHPRPPGTTWERPGELIAIFSLLLVKYSLKLCWARGLPLVQKLFACKHTDLG